MRSVHGELFRWTHVDPGLAAIWDFVNNGPLGSVFAKPDADQQTRARADLDELVSEYRAPDGSYQIPMACRLLWGRA